MRLSTEFIRLPLDFDVDRLRTEVLSVPESAWRPHPQGHPGNSALPLIAVGGDPLDDGTLGPMARTPYLPGLEYLQQVLGSFGTVLGRARLMRLDGNTEATLHVDTNYYWSDRVRIHVPIVTSPAIEFVCGERSLHMPAGQSWIFDAWRPHNVLNTTGERRIHLVADTVGSAQFWDLVDRGQQPFGPGGQPPLVSRAVPYRPGEATRLEIETANFPAVMTPWEMERLAADVVSAGISTTTTGTADHLNRFKASTRAFLRQWRAVWARYGSAREGLDAYRGLLAAYEQGIAPTRGHLTLPNGSDAVGIAQQMLIRPAVNEELLVESHTVPSVRTPLQLGPAPTTPEVQLGPGSAPAVHRRVSRFERPIFIVAPPRSGTTLLFETLAQSPSVWTIGGESHHVIEGIPSLHPASRGWDSNRLAAADATADTVFRLEAGLTAELRDRSGRRPESGPGVPSTLRLLEKTPKNALRVPFLKAAFPDAMFVYIQRDPRESLSSMIAAWESERFVTYPELPGWSGKPWSLALTPEWRGLQGAELAEIAASQWRMCTEILLSDLDKLPADSWGVVGYHNLLADPLGEVIRLCGFLDIEWDRELDGDLPLSRHTLTPPRPDKWQQHAEALERVLPTTADAAHRGRDVLSRPIALTERISAHDPEPDSPFRSVSTPGFAQILGELGSSLVASTYQTGRLMAVRELDGKLNTHLMGMESPMGLSYRDGRLAVGTRSQVWEYQNLPAVVSRLPAGNRYDGCFVPRRVSYTGDIRVHDVGWVADELWVVATRFSCLATIDGRHSFVPRWRPPFITSLAAEDRCHLNGMAVVDDQVRFVTALGVSDEADGWREKRADGGVIIDVESNEIAVSGLSMPHSPRWHRDRLWVLESGEGSLACVDLASGTLETVAKLPGFTRGLAFAGRFAFVGLSEVREANTFGGLPLTGRLEERECGIWVVDIETGQTVAMLRFEDLVEEIFDVALLPGIRFPDLAEHGSDAVNSSFFVPDDMQGQ